VLAGLAKRVYTIERYATLAEGAAERFSQAGITNITQRVGDGTLGMPEFAPFDRIMVTAAAKEVPRAYLDQMAPGSILVIPIEERPGQQFLWRITRDKQGFDHENLLPVRFVPLVEGLPETPE
jgi:protein-L-isoaspartate(D-aspartate) O-methyltransferase